MVVRLCGAAMRSLYEILASGLFFIAAIGSAVQTQAAEVSKDDFGELAGNTAVRLLNVRETPALDAPVVVQLQWGHEVGIHADTYRSVGPLGQSHRWVFVTTGFCVEQDCGRRYAGWVVDKYLATEDRLTPVMSWRVGETLGYFGDYNYTIKTAADGGFALWILACTTGLCGERRLANGCINSSEQREGEHCVSAGRLERYRDLVVADTDENHRRTLLYIEPSGALCSVDTLVSDQTRSCDR